MSDANRNQLWARALFEELARAGVRTMCVAPGSRSTPLVLAGAARDEVEVVTHLDERSAAFFALGVGKATGRPAAVVTTSGTATANLFPAVIEASWAEAPLLLLTADRPPHLRTADANQAVDQVGLYGSYVRSSFDVELPRTDGASLRHLRSLAVRAVADAVGAPAGPVHLNLPFQKPLEPTPVPGDVDPGFADEHPRAALGRPDEEPFLRITRRRSEARAADVEAIAALLGGGARGLVVAGPSPEPGRTGPAARRLSEATGFPLLADPLSGARFSPLPVAPVVEHYDLLLRSKRIRDALRPDVVIRVGASPTSAALCSFLEESVDARQIVVDDGARHKDHLAVARDYVRADPARLLDVLSAAVPRVVSEEWLEGWERLGEATAGIVAEELDGELFEGAVLAEAAAGVPDDGALFVSNSMPVRDLDAFVGSRPSGLEVHGNRGASGIDGIVSTALGLSHGRGGPVTAVLGDLAFYHDMNGLLAAREGRGRVTFVVIHNDGGGIFHMLPIREHEPEFTPLFATPHGLDFRHAAELYDLPYTRVADRAELGEALRADDDGRSRIVEIRTDRERNRRRHVEVEASVRAALESEIDE